MQNTSQLPPKETPETVMMTNHRKEIVEIPVKQENMIALFKAMGYREVKLETEVKADER